MDCESSYYAPVLISVYNRLYTLKKCVAALKKNREALFTDLFIVSDAAGRIVDTERVCFIREFINSITGFKSVTLIARATNLGANRSIGEAVSDLLDRYGKLIFMEDDILPSRYFLEYMNKGLICYEKEPKVFAICGYKHKFSLTSKYRNDIFVLPRYSPWGIGIWRDKYRTADLEQRNRIGELKSKYCSLYEFYLKNDPSFINILQSDSIGNIKAPDVRIEYHLMKTGMVCIYPSKTMTNVMVSGSDAMHSGIKWIAEEQLSRGCPNDFGKINLVPNNAIYTNFLKAKYPGRVRRFICSLKSNGFVWTIVYFIRRAIGLDCMANGNAGYKE